MMSFLLAFLMAFALCFLSEVWCLATRMAACATRSTKKGQISQSESQIIEEETSQCTHAEAASGVGEDIFTPASGYTAEGTVLVPSEDATPSQKLTGESPSPSSFASNAPESATSTGGDITHSWSVLRMLNPQFHPWLVLLPSHLWLRMSRNGGIFAEPVYIAPWVRSIAKSTLCAQPPATSLLVNSTGFKCGEQWIESLWRGFC